MRLTPRKTEIEAVKALLESDAYETADALAKDIIKALWEQLAERDWYALLWKFQSGAPVIAWGPFTSDNEAVKFGQKLPLPGPSQMATLQINSASAQARKDAEAIKAGSPVFCRTCTHPKATHEHTGGGSKCFVKHCRCRQFKDN